VVIQPTHVIDKRAQPGARHRLIFRSLLLVIALFFVLQQSAWAAECSDYLAEAELIEGAVPKLTQDGRIRAIVVYGEASFLAPKSGLISKARTTAELKAKRAFSEWLRSDVAASTKASSALEQVESTNERGETVGLATELTSVIEVMTSNSQATIEGLTKLDECVDINQRLIFVQLGWRPDLAQAARSVSDGSAVNGASAANDTRLPSKIKEAEGYRKRSDLKDAF